MVPADLPKVRPDILGLWDIAMGNESEESRGLSGLISAQRARAARYREQADHFTRLAETEPVEKIRDQWTTVARDYAYLASTLEPDGGLSRGATLYPTARTSPAAGDD